MRLLETAAGDEDKCTEMGGSSKVFLYGSLSVKSNVFTAPSSRKFSTGEHKKLHRLESKNYPYEDRPFLFYFSGSFFRS